MPAATAPSIALNGPNGLAYGFGTLGSGGAFQLSVPLGTPSLAVAILADGMTGVPASVEVRGPGGAFARSVDSPVTGCVRAVTVLDPGAGSWHVSLRAEGPVAVALQVAAYVAPQDEPRESLLAAAVGFDDDPTGGLPRGVASLLAPIATALAPFAGRNLDIDCAGHAVPVVTASDMLGIEPDDVAEAISNLRPGALVVEVTAALVAASGL